MKSAADSALERQWSGLVEAFGVFTDVPLDRHTQTRFESVLDALFTCAHARRSKGLRDFDALLSARADVLPLVRIWIALARFHLARRKPGYAAALETLDGYIEAAPPRTQWIVATNAAGIVWHNEGPDRAYRRIAELEPFAGDEAWQYESTLVASAVTTTLALAMAVGAPEKRTQMAHFAQALWPKGHSSRIRVELMLIDQELARGHFASALTQIDAMKNAVQGDLRLHWTCSRLHALVGSGQQQSRRSRKTFLEFRRAWQEKPTGVRLLSFDERRRLHERVAQLARIAGWNKAPLASSSALASLLHQEKEARRIKDRQRREAALSRVIEKGEAILLGDRVHLHPEELVRTKLLWCRIVVDLEYVEMFDMCELILDQALGSAKQLEFDQLEMQALDQRAVLRARKNPVDWKGAIKDSTLAASKAMQLLTSSAAVHVDHKAERAFLTTLLPVLDRVIDLHAEGALRIVQNSPDLAHEPAGATASILDEESARGSFLRFGRVIHTFAEQSQALALTAARKAFAEGHCAPSRFVVASPGEVEVVVDSFMKLLRPDSAILQYFIFGRYVVIFLYGRCFFDWCLSTIDDEEFLGRPEPAHRKLDDLLRDLRGWTQGEALEDASTALAELHRWIWPAKIERSLERAGIRHLCIVPHDSLYRVPFGRLQTRRGPLLHRFSTSIHATGRLAAESATLRARNDLRPLDLGFVYGPNVDCVPKERAALERAHGRWMAQARIETMNGAALSTKALSNRLSHFDLLHFLCHGEEGGGFGRSPALHLGATVDDRLELSNVIRLPLERCALVVLQSCWTGWMDHRRTNPVQGFPQAFCDAGARAVIAPLTKIPQALAPIFTEVFYRALRFLPAERALQRTLSALRMHGKTLIAKDPAALDALRQHGSMDVFEYRYSGSTGLVSGNIVSRCLGRLSFWWWETRLHWAQNAAK